MSYWGKNVSLLYASTRSQDFLVDKSFSSFDDDYNVAFNKLFADSKMSDLENVFSRLHVVTLTLIIVTLNAFALLSTSQFGSTIFLTLWD